MRMWMVPPRILCRKHLGGEHVECHMFVGTIQKKKNLDGYVKHNCCELTLLRERHDALAREINYRKNKTGTGGGHKSPLPEYDLSYLTENVIHYTVDRKASLLDLINRCPECRKRFEKYIKKVEEKNGG